MHKHPKTLDGKPDAKVPYGPMRPFTPNPKLITKEGQVKQPSTKK